MTPVGEGTQVRPPQASAWNIANALTALRLALVPVFGWLLLHDGGNSTSYRLLAAGVFVVATATDRIDGDIARAKGLVTDFGTVSDPIADKALMGMALVGLSIIGLLPWWVTAVVVVREVGVTALRFVVIRHGVMPASRGGKVKTALQAVAILLYVLPLPLSGFWHSVAVVVMASAVVVTVATGVDYVLRAHTLRNTSPRAQAKRERRAAAAAKAVTTEAAATDAADAVATEASATDAADAVATEASATDAAVAVATEASATDAVATEASERRTSGPEV